MAPANGYGLTETTSAVIANSGSMYFAKKDSVGLPVPVADVRFVGEDGEDVPAGEVGEIWVKGPNNVRGYWQKPAETAAAFTDGWFHTGDAGRIDEDGYVYVVDRIKDMVLRGGENVYCAEVEAAIFELGGVADVAVIGLPHERLGEEVAAVVIRKAGAELSEDVPAQRAVREARRVQGPVEGDLPRQRAASQRDRQGAQARPQAGVRATLTADGRRLTADRSRSSARARDVRTRRAAPAGGRS